MGENGGAEEVVVAVDGVGAVDDRDREARGERPPLHLVHHVGPVRGGGGGAGREGRAAAAGAEDGADGEAGEGGAGGDAALDLRHLRRLLPQRHAREEVADARLHRLGRVLVDQGQRLARRHGRGGIVLSLSLDLDLDLDLSLSLSRSGRRVDDDLERDGFGR